MAVNFQLLCNLPELPTRFLCAWEGTGCSAAFRRVFADRVAGSSSAARSVLPATIHHAPKTAARCNQLREPNPQLPHVQLANASPPLAPNRLANVARSQLLCELQNRALTDREALDFAMERNMRGLLFGCMCGWTRIHESRDLANLNANAWQDVSPFLKSTLCCSAARSLPFPGHFVPRTLLQLKACEQRKRIPLHAYAFRCFASFSP